MVDWGLMEVKMVEHKLGNAATAADPVQPKEGPTRSHIEHHKGMDRDHLLTGITN